MGGVPYDHDNDSDNNNQHDIDEDEHVNDPNCHFDDSHHYYQHIQYRDDYVEHYHYLDDDNGLL